MVRFVKFKTTTLVFLMIINICYGYIYAPLRRDVRSFELEDDKEEINFKSEYNVPNKLINIIKSEIKGKRNRGYYVSIGIGSPPQTFNFIIDTGSSNFAVSGVPHPHIAKYFESQKSASFVNYGIKVYLPYSSGSWKGLLVSDIFTLDGASSIGDNETLNSLKIKSNFTVIQSSNTFFPQNSEWEGIWGLAYSVLSQPNYFVKKTTLFDDIIRSTRIPDMFSVALCGQKKDTKLLETHGYFILGGINESLFEPPMINIMIRRKWFYEIIISSISVSNKPIIISNCKEYNTDKTILDTGSTDTLLPTLVFRSLVLSIINHLLPHPFPLYKSSPFWNRKAVLCTPSTNKSPPPTFFPEVHFHLVINDTASLHVALSPQQYISYIGDQINIFGYKRNCYKFGFGESKTGTILGDSFLEGFYLVFDRAAGKVGIAQSTCNSQYPGISRSRIVTVYTDQGGLLSCAVKNTSAPPFIDFLTSGITLVFGLLLGMILLIALFIILIIQWRDKDEPEASLIFGSYDNVHMTTDYRSFK